MDYNFVDAAQKLSAEYRGEHASSCGICIPHDASESHPHHLVLDLNGSTFEVLKEPPSALEFARIVHISRPVVIKGVDVPAMKLWDNDYLIEKMGDRPISIAVTPNGCADAITRAPDNRLYFVEPATEKMTMHELLNTLEARRRTNKRSKEIHYLQSQNGNLFAPNENCGEFEPLKDDVPKEIPWCSDALGQKPEAVNIWIGDEGSRTSLHSDPYENIYTVIRGMKHFLLVPPTDSWCLQERLYPHATYKRNGRSGRLEIIPSAGEDSQVRWSSITDPCQRGALPRDVGAIHIALQAGETLYLPVGWWHYVWQSGLTIALNWWYDAELRGTSWVLLNFLRNPTSIILPGNTDESTDD